uniref:Histone-lysine N-methyltransferase 2C n=1 Tax=Strigamia maritima TaxID=126957 RepID=T1IZ38_STRMM
PRLRSTESKEGQGSDGRHHGSRYYYTIKIKFCRMTGVIVKNLLPGEWQYIAEGNKHIVLRIPKDQCVLRIVKEEPDEPDQSVFSRLELSLKYVEEVMKPLIGKEFVAKGASELIKITGKELAEIDQFRPDFRKFKKLNTTSCLGVKLPDCTTCIPSKYDNHNKIGPVLAVELKLKMGFLNPGVGTEKKMCKYQSMQRKKLKENRIAEINTYCPLDLFSGHDDKMKFALKSLLKNPQNNLRLFVNGVLVYGDNQLSTSGLNKFLQETTSCRDQLEDKFCELVISCLLHKLLPEKSTNDYHEYEKCGCEVSGIKTDVQKGVFKHCVLGRILTAQKLKVDNGELLRTYEEIKTLLNNYPTLMQYFLIYGLHSDVEEMPNLPEEFKTKLNSISQFLVSAAAKDCSVMLTMQRVEKQFDDDAQNNLIQIDYELYAFNITVVDLDMKPHERILQTNAIMSSIQTEVNIKIISLPRYRMDIPGHSNYEQRADGCTSKTICTKPFLDDRISLDARNRDLLLPTGSIREELGYFSNELQSLPQGLSLSVDSIGSTQVTLPLAPVIPKRGPGRPRKDGSGPIQRKKPPSVSGRQRGRRKHGHFHTQGGVSAMSICGIGAEPPRPTATFPPASALGGPCGLLYTSPSMPFPLSSMLMEHKEKSEIGELGADSDASLSSAVSMERINPDEPQEQWPGKSCSFCNLGEKSLLGQGELTRFEPSMGFNPFKRVVKARRDSSESDQGSQPDRSPKVITWRRHRGPGKLGKTRKSFIGLDDDNKFQSPPIDELSLIGFAEEPEPAQLFELSGHVYAHHCCAAWSDGVCQTDDYLLVNVDKAVATGLTQKCSNCHRFGATITCKIPKCNKMYHYPCAASSGTFQDIKTLSLLCPQHLNQAPVIAQSEANCMMCDVPGDIAELLFCTSCGHHYHGVCLDPNVNVNPVVRAGWQCPECKICQTCRQPGDDNKMLMCDTCDKGYHTFCLKPAMTTIPKHGWKCKNCRVCTDCGSHTPGSGPSSRWHRNYTVCDSCYQQRNKGLACPLCGRAYRHFTQKDMVQCNVCRKYIHAKCDSEIDLLTIQQQRDVDLETDYVCPLCNPNRNRPEVNVSKDESLFSESSILTSSQDLTFSPNEDSVCSMDIDLQAIERSAQQLQQLSGVAPLGLFDDMPNVKPMSILSSKPLLSMGKLAGRKRMGVGRPRGSTKFVGIRRRVKTADFGKRRGPKPKLKPGQFVSTTSSFQHLTSLDSTPIKHEDEPGIENKIVLCSAKDEHVLTQDLCVMCGSFGQAEEGRLIACSQCGQCYHPYCVSVKITKVVLSKGWRCLDCTVCEGCGQPHDEGRLLLCDDCDISYHIYCLDPPLEQVPQGNWKCKWCVVCLQCGSTSPGFKSQWQNNYTHCGPCASQFMCPVCHINYQEDELIIQCIQCDRWLHTLCDQIRTEEEAEKAADCGYHCIMCRPKDQLPPHLVPQAAPQKPIFTEIVPVHKPPNEAHLKTSAQFFVDGVCLSEIGMHQIKSLIIEQPKKIRMRRSKLPQLPYKQGDMRSESISLEEDASIDQILDAEKLDVGDEDLGKDLGKLDDSIPGEKKKRQRNLQKLGVGGFIAKSRCRANKDQEKYEGIESKYSDNYSGVGDPPNYMDPFGQPEKPKRRRRIKKKSQLEDSYPSYLQEAFFGKDLLHQSKEHDISLDAASDDDEISQTTSLSLDKTIILKETDRFRATLSNIETEDNGNKGSSDKTSLNDDDDITDSEALKDILPLPQDLPQDDELVDMLMNEEDPLSKHEEGMGDISDAEHTQESSTTNKDDPLTDILGSHFNLDTMVSDSGLPQMDSKEVEDLIKGVFPDESHIENSESDSTFHVRQSSLSQSTTLATGSNLQRSVSQTLSLSSPFSSLPPPSPYPSDYNSPQFSPGFSEPPSPWTQHETDLESPSHSQRNFMKWETDEALGAQATISAVLYANINHPDLKKDYPNWNERSKQIAKIWRGLPADTRQPYLQKARENRAASRVQKAQQMKADVGKQQQARSPKPPPPPPPPPPQIDLGPLSPRRTTPLPSEKEQEKLFREQKSQREQQQERQWKQLQALRHQQAQQQQQVLHDQRAQVPTFENQQVLQHQNAPNVFTGMSRGLECTNDGVITPDGSHIPPGMSEQFPRMPPRQQIDSMVMQQQNDPYACQPGTPHPGLMSPRIGQAKPAVPAQLNAMTSQAKPAPPPQGPGLGPQIPMGMRMSSNFQSPIQVSRVRPPIDPSQMQVAARVQGDLSFAEPPNSLRPDQFGRHLSSGPASPQISPQQVRTPDPYAKQPFTPRPSVVGDSFGAQRMQDPYQTPPSTPRPLSISDEFMQPATPRVQQDVYSQKPATPCPQMGPFSPAQIPRSAMSGDFAKPRMGQEPFNQMQSSQAMMQSMDPYNRMPRPDKPCLPQRHESPIVGPRLRPEAFTMQQSPVESMSQATTPEAFTGHGGGDVFHAQSPGTPIPPQSPRPDQFAPPFSVAGGSDALSLQEQLLWQQMNQGDGDRSNQVTRQHLRDLLQKQQMKRQMEQQLREQQGQMPLRHWPPNIPMSRGSLDSGFRQPYPPTLRQRAMSPGQMIPMQAAVRGSGLASPPGSSVQQMMARSVAPIMTGQIGVNHGPQFRHPNQLSDLRQQPMTATADPRLRMTLMQQRLLQSGGIRLGSSPFPNNNNNPLDPYDHLVQQQQQQQQQQQHRPLMASHAINPQIRYGQPTPGQPLQPSMVGGQRLPIPPVLGPSGNMSMHLGMPQVSTQQSLQQQVQQQTMPNVLSSHQQMLSGVTSSTSHHTASLPDVELEGDVAEDLDKLHTDGPSENDLPKDGEGDQEEELELDDDELLGLGNDFNILEYADPELDKDAVGDGKKTNILDENLDLDDKDEDLEDEEEKNKREHMAKVAAAVTPSNTIKTEMPEPTSLAIKDADMNKKAMSLESDFQAKFLEFSQRREIDKNEELKQGEIFEDESLDSSITAKIEEVDNKPQIEQFIPPNTSRGGFPQQENANKMGLMAGVSQAPFGQPAVSIPQPPPYPGTAVPPPPPYQGPVRPQTMAGFSGQQTMTMRTALQQRSVLLQEQPHLLEDLLEQEKEEQRRQQHQGLIGQTSATGDEGLLSDIDFEKLKADVLGSQGPTVMSPGPAVPAQGMLPVPSLPGSMRLSHPRADWQAKPELGPGIVFPPAGPLQRPTRLPVMQSAVGNLVQRPPLNPAQDMGMHPLLSPRPAFVPIAPPPTPPIEPVTDAEKQQMVHYEHWLMHNKQNLEVQTKMLSEEVQKFRKSKKSLNTKQRQLRKNGQELGEVDAMELERIIRDQTTCQKQLEQVRKHGRQHDLKIQDYQLKQQKRQQHINIAQQQHSAMLSMQHSPLGPSPSPLMGPSTPQSPMMSPSSLGPSPSPMMQQSTSPMMQQSPLSAAASPMMQHSPHSQIMYQQQSPRLVAPQADGRNSSLQVTQDDNNPFSDSFQQRELRNQQPRLMHPHLPAPQGDDKEDLHQQLSLYHDDVITYQQARTPRPAMFPLDQQRPPEQRFPGMCNVRPQLRPGMENPQQRYILGDMKVGGPPTSPALRARLPDAGSAQKSLPLGGYVQQLSHIDSAISQSSSMSSPMSVASGSVKGSPRTERSMDASNSPMSPRVQTNRGKEMGAKYLPDFSTGIKAEAVDESSMKSCRSGDKDVRGLEPSGGAEGRKGTGDNMRLILEGTSGEESNCSTHARSLTPGSVSQDTISNDSNSRPQSTMSWQHHIPEKTHEDDGGVSNDGGSCSFYGAEKNVSEENSFRRKGKGKENESSSDNADKVISCSKVSNDSATSSSDANSQSIIERTIKSEFGSGSSDQSGHEKESMNLYTVNIPASAGGENSQTCGDSGKISETDWTNKNLNQENVKSTRGNNEENKKNDESLPQSGSSIVDKADSGKALTPKNTQSPAGDCASDKNEVQKRECRDNYPGSIGKEIKQTELESVAEKPDDRLSDEKNETESPINKSEAPLQSDRRGNLTDGIKNEVMGQNINKTQSENSCQQQEVAAKYRSECDNQSSSGVKQVFTTGSCMQDFKQETSCASVASTCSKPAVSDIKSIESSGNENTTVNIKPEYTAAATVSDESIKTIQSHFAAKREQTTPSHIKDSCLVRSTTSMQSCSVQDTVSATKTLEQSFASCRNQQLMHFTPSSTVPTFSTEYSGSVSVTTQEVGLVGNPPLHLRLASPNQPFGPRPFSQYQGPRNPRLPSGYHGPQIGSPQVSYAMIPPNVGNRLCGPPPRMSTIPYTPMVNLSSQIGQPRVSYPSNPADLAGASSVRAQTALHHVSKVDFPETSPIGNPPVIMPNAGGLNYGQPPNNGGMLRVSQVGLPHQMTNAPLVQHGLALRGSIMAHQQMPNQLRRTSVSEIKRESVPTCQHEEIRIGPRSLEEVLGKPEPKSAMDIKEELLSEDHARKTPKDDDMIPQNALLKQLLQNSQPQKKSSNEKDHDIDEAVVLTPEQQRQLEMIDRMPLTHEVGGRSEADLKSNEAKQILIEIRRIHEQEEAQKGLKRRQMQPKRQPKQPKLKDGIPSKKRSRKGSGAKPEEDYDSYMGNMMAQLRSLPPLRIVEPAIPPCFNVCPLYGGSDIKPALTPEESPTTSKLRGMFGNATLINQVDYYSVYPFGSNPPTPPASLPPTPPPHRGFYNQEFPTRYRDNTRRSTVEVPASLPTPPPQVDQRQTPARDADSPDTIISASSPECVYPESVDPLRYLRLIRENDEYNDEFKSVSPGIPLSTCIPIKVIPIRPKQDEKLKDLNLIDEDDNGTKDKENQGSGIDQMRADALMLKSKLGFAPPVPLKESGNVSVTLTLNSAAAEDIPRVLAAVANLLKVAPPSTYEVIERTATPPSREAGVDIQSILNGKPRFCRHCDVVVLSAGIRKKASELSFLSKDEQEEDEVIFCSTNCYMQFAITHRTSAIEEKEAATVVDHVSDGCGQARTEESEKKLNLIRKPAEKEAEVVIEENLIPVDVRGKEIPTKLEEKLRIRKYSVDDGITHEPNVKKWRGLRWKYWNLSVVPPKKYTAPSDEEINEVNICIRPRKMPDDIRQCVLCQDNGDGFTNGPARLLNIDVDKWIHLNCALWSSEVYETVNGALMNVDAALKRSAVLECVLCHKKGATLGCFKLRCINIYHFGCALKECCMFFKDKTMLCPQHIPKQMTPELRDNELSSLSVFRRVYVNREETRQVACIMHQGDQKYLLRVGSLIFLSVGQLLPHQLQAFHTQNCIFPVGFKIVRMYWSMRALGRRCPYVCGISDRDGKPEFWIQVRDEGHDEIILKDSTAKGVWQKVLAPIEKMRSDAKTIKVFTAFITGEDLFGLTEPSVLRVLESLPGVETLSDYNFKYGRSPLLDLPLAINPTGCARSELKLRTHFKRPHTLHTSSSSRSSFQTNITGMEVACPYTKQFVHSKSSQYRRMKTEWRNNVYLARSRIQGLGLYASRDLEKHTMVIEYIGQTIRNEVSELRERMYDDQNRGIYMFRLDDSRVIDATLTGGLARYINHSCNPNCVAEVVPIDRESRIIIFANRRISRGEELTYDYKFDIEDDQHKINCLCGAPNCKKWMN